MGSSEYKYLNKCKGVGALFALATLVHAQPSPEGTPSLGEAFNSGAPEVEPVIVGRERWNEKPPAPTDNQPVQSSAQSSPQESARINELDPLETQQVQIEPGSLPIEPPKNKPATLIVRNFEGTLVFKPRKFGFENKFPYQLENSKGKRLAYLDTDQIKGLNPQQFVDQPVNVLGKLEAIKEGSDDRVIRARVIRPSN